MDPTAYICGLMRENTNAVGFIPEPAIRGRFVKTGRYILQQDRWGKVVGYLIYGPVSPDGTLRVHQAAIELDKRFKHFGQMAIIELINRARKLGARRVFLRCAEDLEAVVFWHQCGFLATHFSTGGQRRTRTIVNFRLDLEPLQL